MQAADTYSVAQQGSNSSQLQPAPELKCSWSVGTRRRSPGGWRWLLIFMDLDHAKIMHADTIHLAGTRDQKSAVTNPTSPSLFSHFPVLAILASCKNFCLSWAA